MDRELFYTFSTAETTVKNDSVDEKLFMCFRRETVVLKFILISVFVPLINMKAISVHYQSKL